MKLTIAQETFAEALTTVYKGTARTSTYPILSGILLVANEEGLTLSATDLQLSLTVKASANVEEPGEVVLPGRTLVEWVRKLPTGKEVALRYDREAAQATLTCAKAKAKLSGMEADQFPTVPTPNPIPSFSLPHPVIRKLVNKTHFATSKDETRPHLTGVHFKREAGAGELTACATDGVRIAHQKVIVEPGDELNVIVPTRALTEIARFAAGGDGDQVEITVNENNLVFSFERVAIATRLLDGTFPDVLRLVPQVFETNLKLDIGPFVEALDRAALITKDGAVKLEIGESVINLSSDSESSNGREEVAILEMAGEGLTIGFNSRLLIEGFKAIAGECVQARVSLNRPNAPVLVQAVNDDSYFYLVLPLIVV